MLQARTIVESRVPLPTPPVLEVVPCEGELAHAGRVTHLKYVETRRPRKEKSPSLRWTPVKRRAEASVCFASRVFNSLEDHVLQYEALGD